MPLPERQIINDSWVLERVGAFSNSFSGFLTSITGGLKLTETVKAGLDVARIATDFGETGFVKPLIDKILSSLGTNIEPEVKNQIQKKLSQAQQTTHRKLNTAEQKQRKILETKLREKEKTFAALDKRLASLDAHQEKLADSLGQKVALQLFSTNMNSLVDALYTVAKERGITNEEILGLIQALPELEALMYIMNVRKFYRDHTAHSLRVAALGDFLLDKEGFAGGLEDLIMEKLGLTKDEVRTTWWFTGLLHDIGTPLAKLFTSLNWSLINEMTRCYSPLGIDFFPLQISVNHPELGNTGYLKILCKGIPKKWQTIISNGLGVTKQTPNSFRYSGQRQEHIEYIPRAPLIDHGVVAAVTLLRTLGTPEYVAAEHAENRPLIEAARAIALHDSIEKLDLLPFEDYPLLFLLAVCDELQEWGRPIPVSSKVGYFTTALQKVTLTESIFHDSQTESWDVPFTNAQAKALMHFDFKRLQKDKEAKLHGLDCTEQFPETDLLLIDYDKTASRVSDKYEIKIQSH
jgi:hypothetical protein